MATMEERLAALEEKVQKLTTPPDDYYMSRWTGEQIDDAVAKINSADGLVTAFNGRSGAVMPQAGDYTAAMVGAASIGEDGKIPESQLPQLTSNVTLYVNASTGSDGNPGTSSQPFATIQAAVDSLPKNLGQYTAKILVGDGTYSEDVLISGFFNGMDAGLTDVPSYNGLIIQGQSGASPVIRSLRIIGCSVPSILIQQLSVSGGLSTGDANIIQGTGVALHNCQNVVLSGVVITGCTRGIMCGGYYTSGGTTMFLNGGSVSDATNTAVMCVGQNNVYAEGLSGSGNAIGLYAQYGGVITTRALTMTATTAQKIYAGFINTF